MCIGNHVKCFLQDIRMIYNIDIDIGLDAFSDENKCTTPICLFTKNQTPMGKNAFWRDPISTFWAGILYKEHFTKYRAPYFNKRLMFGIATKTKITRGKPTWKFFVFRLRSFHRLQDWERTKNLKKPKENKKTKKTQVSGEMLCPQISSRFCCFFCISFGFLVFRQKKTRRKPKKTKKPKKPKSWETCCAQGFPPGDWFFWVLWFLWFFGFSWSFFGF